MRRLVLASALLILSCAYSQNTVTFFKHYQSQTAPLRGQHILIHFADPIPVETELTVIIKHMQDRVGRFERGHILTDNLILLLIPNDLPDTQGSPHMIEIYDSSANLVTTPIALSIRGDLIDHIRSDSCGNTLPSTSRIPCISPARNNNGTRNVLPDSLSVNSSLLAGALTQMPFLVNLPNTGLINNHLVFTNGLQISSVTLDGFPQNLLDLQLVKSSGFFNHFFSGGYNEILFLYKDNSSNTLGFWATTINIIDTQIRTLDQQISVINFADEIVLTFFPGVPDSQFSTSLINIIEAATQLKVKDHTFFGGEVGICSGSQLIFSFQELENSQIDIGRALSLLSSSSTRSTIEAAIRLALGDNSFEFVDYTVDPQPSLRGGQTVGQIILQHPDPLQLGQVNSKYKIAILDTGVNTLTDVNLEKINPSLEESFFSNPTAQPNLSNPRVDTFIGGEINQGRPPNDRINIGHGTGLALLAGSQDYGIAHGAEIWSIKVCSEQGLCLGSDVVQGICHTVQPQVVGGVEHENIIVNLSMGTNTPLKSLQRVIHDISLEGVTVVASAGNQGDPESNNGFYNLQLNAVANCPQDGFPNEDLSEECFIDSQLQFPAANRDTIFVDDVKLPSISPIAVGATDNNMHPQPYSNRGAYVDIVVPDTQLFIDPSTGTLIDLTGHMNNFESGTPLDVNQRALLIQSYKGTSFSTSYISGAAAFLKENAQSALTPQDIRQCLQASATIPPALSLYGLFAVGSGIPDLSMACP